MWPFSSPKFVPLNDGILRKAVLVGINAYDGCPLDGCVNDANDVKKFLIEKHGFDPANIKILLDSKATTEAIKEALVWLTSGLKAGDIIAFWYSGHGAQTPNPNEADGLSECICPVDFDWSRERMITDKDLVEIFSTIPEGVIFNWGSDSCHSGDLDRDFKIVSQQKRGFFPRLWRRMFGTPRKASKSMPVPFHIAGAIRKARINAKNMTPKSMGLNVGFLAGCRSDQTSADTEVNGRPCGALTHYFLKNWADALSLAIICSKIIQDFAQDGYDQIPCAEGSRRDRPWLKP